MKPGLWFILEQNSSSPVNLPKQISYRLPNYNGEAGPKIHISIPKQRNRKGKGVIVARQVWQVPLNFKAWDLFSLVECFVFWAHGAGSVGWRSCLLRPLTWEATPTFEAHAVAPHFGTGEVVAQPLASGSKCQWQTHQPLNFPRGHFFLLLKNNAWIRGVSHCW